MGRGEDPLEAALPDLYALTRAEEFPVRAMSVTRKLVGADKGDYTEFDPGTGAFRVLVDPEPPQLRLLEEARAAFMREHPVLPYYLRTGETGARMISDFLSTTEFRRLGLYGEFFGPLGVDHQLTVLVAGRSASQPAGISLDREGMPFSDHDRGLLDRLQPHLAAAQRNATAFSQALSRAPGAEEAPGRQLAGRARTAAAAIDRLTARERDVLAHVASGHTNAQIARALDISAGTVRKHVEHILARLGAPSRTAAAVCYITAAAPHQGPPWTAVLASLNESAPRR
jgi:DNA-binding CsgD family transcriptional regulator